MTHFLYNATAVSHQIKTTKLISFLQIFAFRLSTMVAVKTSYDDVNKSQEDKRSYRALELNNGIKVNTQHHIHTEKNIVLINNWLVQVLLVSDETTDKSAAALDVHIGHMSDPTTLPGLAHFCEHMLFLGG